MLVSKKLLAVLTLLFTISLSASAQDTLVGKALKWYLPDHVKLQFAGGIGFLSGGPGYVSKNKTLETDLLLGYLPEKLGGDALVSATLKTSYSPWFINLKNTYHIAPFTIGAYLSYTFGPQFDSKWPSYYPKGYYWWATAFRPGAYIGGKAGRELPFSKRKRELQLYYELGTYDLLLISYVQNTGYLRPGDILNLSFGLKLGF
jgi:hypothetical protein